MIDLFPYLIKSSLSIALFWGVYFLFLRKSNRHFWNRQYLIITLILSTAIPFLKLPSTVEVKPLIAEEITFMDDFVIEENVATPNYSEPVSPVQQEPAKVSIWPYITWIYLAVVMLFMCRSIMHIFLLQQLKNNSQCIDKRTFKVYKTTHGKPFSFLRSVFIPNKLFHSKLLEPILSHEWAHVKQLHSIDRLLMDFYVSLFWFNPFIYLYRKALIEVHEYQADQAAVERMNDPIIYQEALFAQLSTVRSTDLVSHFNFSLIKKRIVMINKNNTKTSFTYHLLALPLVALVIFAFSSRDSHSRFGVLQDEITVMMGPIIAPVQISNNIPSISPVRDKDLKRLSSGYGRRIDPFDKAEKFHSGVDFSAATGSDILATADGKVIETDYEPDTYGYYLVVDHGIYQTRYHHLSEILVGKGEEVVQRDVIGLVGNTGRSTAPHLHYEVIKNGEHVNPIKYVGLKQSQEEPVPSISPVKFEESDNILVSSSFGYQMDPYLKVRRPHRGIDFTAPTGVNVYATADGIVQLTEEDAIGGYGYQILLEHGEYATRYAHLSEIKVQERQQVKKGDIIGLVGNSGRSTAPHLHYEVIKNGEHVNPIKYVGLEQSQEEPVPSISPVKFEESDEISVNSHFGYRMDPLLKVRRHHSGIDFKAPVGIKVYATADGEVELVEVKKIAGYGTQIMLKHGEYSTRYAHLSEVKVELGQQVKKGDIIGLVGNTGKSTMPHLHYEIRKENNPVNPVHYIKDYQISEKPEKEKDKEKDKEKEK